MADPDLEKRKRGRLAGPHPLYHRVYVDLRQTLLDGSADPHVALPSEPALAQRYGVSRVTVRRTLEELEAEGLVRRVRGVGTFPVVGQPAERQNISGLVENLITVDAATTADLLSWGEAEPTGAALHALGPGLSLKIRRLRRFGGAPISLSTLHVPLDLARVLNPATIGSDPVILALEKAGIVAERNEQGLSALSADSEAATLLGVAAGAPLIVMRRTMRNGAGRAILHQESLYPPDRFEYRMTLSRVSIGRTARWAPVG